MDDDDFMDWRVIADLIGQMQARPEIDMAVSSYRFLWDGKIQPGHRFDIDILDSVLKHQSSRVIGLEGNEDLLRMTSYPWNKVYRTDFIRRIGLRFSETAVQNDIFAHWQSLLHATRILVTNLVQCTQTVNKRSARIGNIADHRRLQAFIALRETYEMLRSHEMPRVEAVFWRFYLHLTRWIFSISSAATLPLLMREHVTFAGMMPPEMSGLEAETGVKRWEIWDMKQLADMVPPPGVKAASSPDIEEWEICLTEMSRLKRLATELRVDNERLRGSLHPRNIESLHLRNIELETRYRKKRRKYRNLIGGLLLIILALISAILFISWRLWS
jgi:hypothetical protein